MMRCKGILAKQNITEPEKTKLEGFLQTALIDCILEKVNEDGNEVKDLEVVTKQFLVKALGGDSPNSSSQAVTSSSVSADQVLQYDSDGNAVAVPKMSLMLKGFKAGGLFYKGKDEEAKKVWKPSSVDDDGMRVF